MDALGENLHSLCDEFVVLVGQDRLDRSLALLLDAEPPRARVDELLPPVDRRLERLEAQEPERAEAAHDAREARVPQGAAQDGRKVGRQAVLGEVGERVPVGDALEGEAAQQRDVGEVLREEFVGRDGDVVAGEAEGGRVERGGEDASRGPPAQDRVSEGSCKRDSVDARELVAERPIAELRARKAAAERDEGRDLRQGAVARSAASRRRAARARDAPCCRSSGPPR